MKQSKYLLENTIKIIVVELSDEITKESKKKKKRLYYPHLIL